MTACTKCVFLSATGILLIFLAVVNYSCTPDKCKGITCAYGGVCTDGACLCATGYEGSRCETISRKRYIGAWQVYDSSYTTGIIQYPLVTDADTDITGIVIVNLFNYFTEKPHAIISSDTIVVPLQTLNGKQVIGSGYYDRSVTTGQVVFNYDITDPASGTVDHRYSIWHLLP